MSNDGTEFRGVLPEISDINARAFLERSAPEYQAEIAAMAEEFGRDAAVQKVMEDSAANRPTQS